MTVRDVVTAAPGAVYRAGVGRWWHIRGLGERGTEGAGVMEPMPKFRWTGADKRRRRR